MTMIKPTPLLTTPIELHTSAKTKLTPHNCIIIAHLIKNTPKSHQQQTLSYKAEEVLNNFPN